MSVDNSGQPPSPPPKMFNASALGKAIGWTVLVFAAGVFVLLIQWAAYWLTVVPIEPWHSYVRTAGLAAMLLGVAGSVLVDAYFSPIEYPGWAKICLVVFPITLGCLVALVTIKANMMKEADPDIPTMATMQYALLVGTIAYATAIKYLLFCAYREVRTG